MVTLSTLSLILAFGLSILSGLPGLFHGPSGQRAAPILLTAAAIAASAAACLTWFGQPFFLAIPGITALGSWSLRCDGVSAWFLVPVFWLPALASWYGKSYWTQAAHPESAARMGFWLGILPAAMGLVVIAHHAIPFMLGWEGMTLAAWFLIGGDDNQEETRRAGYLYLAAAHIGVLALFAGFAVLSGPTLDLNFDAIAQRLADPHVAGLAFALMGLGFAVKAGVMPLHIWLPSAHAAAPSHISAVLSGVLLKIGIYGFVRLLQWTPEPPLSWATLLLVFGALSSVWGVALALGQHDLKRLLAYHSVENIGIILMGLAMASAGLTLHLPLLTALGFTGALLHTWNHALFKSLLFFAAGGAVHALGTREIDHMGGLARAMPRTALLFTVGSMAICGLPPLNGFISEWSIYLGAFHGLGAWPLAAFAVLALALTGALALACFTKVLGAVFLGTPRRDAAEAPGEVPLGMQWPMALLAISCLFIGVFPGFLAPALAATRNAIAAPSPAAPQAGWGVMTAVALAAALVALPLWAKLRRTARATAVTWDCGHAQSSPRIQYTAVSFADSLVGNLRWFLLPKRDRPEVHGLFPVASRGLIHVTDLFMDKGVTPVARLAARFFGQFRFLHPGHIQLYLIYMALALLATLVWAFTDA